MAVAKTCSFPRLLGISRMRIAEAKVGQGWVGIYLLSSAVSYPVQEKRECVTVCGSRIHESDYLVEYG